MISAGNRCRDCRSSFPLGRIGRHLLKSLRHPQQRIPNIRRRHYLRHVSVFCCPRPPLGRPQIRQARPFFVIASPCEAAPVRQVGVPEVPWGRLAASAEAPLIYVNIARPQHGNVAPPKPAWQLRQLLPFVSIDRPPCRNAAGVQFFVFAGVARRLAWKLLTWFHWPASTDQTLPRLILLSDAVGQVDAGPPREALRQKEFATGGPQGLPGQR
jgi:hypothetical protein